MVLPDIQAANVTGKTVILRVDTDIPLNGETILDDSRLRASRETIDSLIHRNAKVVIVGHLGRPEGKIVPELSLKPVAWWYFENLKSQISNHKMEDVVLSPFHGWKIGESVILLENIRFFPGEEKNDPELAQQTARLGQIYCNDAFAVSHRSHCSTVGIARLLPHYAGVRLQEEVRVLSGLLDNPKRPMAVIIGGAKIETKLPLIEKMEEVADHVLVGGKIAQEYKGGNQKVVVAAPIADKSDITEESVQKFLDITQQCSTVVWNGPVGIINEKFLELGSHMESSEKGTRLLAEGLAKSSAYKVIGGGDTVEFVERLGLTSKFDFVSTGGGAMLAFLSGEKLPGLEVLLS